jgi:adenosylcobyric acid synthase
MTAAALMFQGTGSDVGKSVLVAGLARAFANRGLRVRPFKPQNMSNNAAVTPDGGEIGRAQALQARAARCDLSTDLNPVLLKPQTEVGAQVVVHGRVRGNAGAREYQRTKGALLPDVLASYNRLREDADLVLVEGAGSASEVNLRQGDIANMGFAEAARCPVVLIGDIDRGGVIASLVGTWALLRAAERPLIAGYLINKFRGDTSLFDGGIAVIREHTGLRSFGIVTFFAEAAKLPAEDALSLENRRAETRAGAAIKVAVPMLSRIANFDDLDPLSAEPDVEVSFVPRGRALPGDADLVVLPGSKATLADLEVIRAQGWDLDLVAHRRRGGWILGLCGGYQMLGRTLADPHGTEGAAGTSQGLGWLEVDTELAGDKQLVAAEGRCRLTGAAVHGYEMHIGRTTGPGLDRPLLDLNGRPDGAVSDDGRVLGSYLHGLFASDRFRHAFLARLKDRNASGLAYEAEVEATLDRLAQHLEGCLDLDGLLEAARHAG